MINRIKRNLSLFCLSILLSTSASADESLGRISDNTIGSLSILNELMMDMFYILGTAFILGALIQYKAYRNNPLQVPISRPITLLVFGLIFLALPFAVQLSIGASILSS